MLAGGLGQVPVFLPADFLILQRFEERCGHRIVPGIGGPAHADGNAVVLEQVGINRGRRAARRGRNDVPARAAAAASRAGKDKSRPAQPPPEGTGVPPPSLGTLDLENPLLWSAPCSPGTIPCQGSSGYRYSPLWSASDS